MVVMKCLTRQEKMETKDFKQNKLDYLKRPKGRARVRKRRKE